MSNTAIEYELTYLAREIPAEIRSALPIRMVDVYVPADVHHPYLRLRKEGNTYVITKKQPKNDSNFSIHTEQTIPLSQNEFEALASGQTRMIEKDRYKVSLNGRPAEVDVFSGKLEGLVLIDFEFLNEADMRAFAPPACCLADVTNQEFVAGGVLSGKSYADITADLTRCGYRPLHL
jgi:adenylate cyclase